MCLRVISAHTICSSAKAPTVEGAPTRSLFSGIPRNGANGPAVSGCPGGAAPVSSASLARSPGSMPRSGGQAPRELLTSVPAIGIMTSPREWSVEAAHGATGSRALRSVRRRPLAVGRWPPAVEMSGGGRGQAGWKKLPPGGRSGRTAASCSLPECCPVTSYWMVWFLPHAGPSKPGCQIRVAGVRS